MQVMASEFGTEGTTFSPPIVVDNGVVLSQRIPICVHIGRRCGFTPPEVDEVKALQYMHDILDLFERGLEHAASIGGAAGLLSFLRGDTSTSSAAGVADPDACSASSAAAIPTPSRFRALAGTIERQIKGPFYFGTAPTYVDFFLVQCLDRAGAWALDRLVEAMGVPDFFAPFTKIRTIAARIHTLPSGRRGAELPTLTSDLVAHHSLIEACVRVSRPAASTPELFYFGMPCRAAIIRMCFHVGGHPFKDTVIERSSWNETKITETFPLSCVPMLRHRDMALSQSQAIAGYAAALALGSEALTATERAVDAMLVATYEDILVVNAKASPVSGGSAAALPLNIRSMMDKYFAPIELLLPAGAWLHGGDRPSLGDLAVYAMSSFCHSKFGPKAGWSEIVPQWEEGFPKIKHLHDRVRGLDSLAPYFETYGAYHW